MRKRHALHRRSRRYAPRSVLVLFYGCIVCTSHAQPAADALPALQQVTEGQVTVRASAARADVEQITDRAIIEWRTFDVGRGAHVNFNQPSSSSVTLNRVLDAQASQIFGRLTANGQVFLSNPHGIYFAPGAQVDIGALVATTHAISDEDFLNGPWRFTRAVSGASVVNEGDIRVRDGGYVALLANDVRNGGVIQARLGTVALAAGDAFLLEFDDATLSNVLVEPSQLAALVENRHAIVAPGGRVLMTARAADDLVGGSVNHSGHITATGLSVRDGVIVLEASGGIDVDGTLDASSAIGTGGRIDIHAGDTAVVTGDVMANGGHNGAGGRVAVTGARIGLLDDATISATGASGGEVYIGGGWQGSDPVLRNADAVVMANDARIDVSAAGQGNGGTVVLWSERYTGFYGGILARGGDVETSSRDNLQAFGSVNAGAWLLDPRNVTITTTTTNGSFDGGSPNTFTPTADNATANASTINTSLNSGTSVTVTTGGTGTQQGRITLSSAINKTGNNTATLTLNAAQDIILDAGISASNGALNVVLEAGSGSIVANQDITTSGGYIDFRDGVYVGGSGARTFTTTGGAVDFRGDLLIGNSNGLTINTTNGGADGAVTFAGKVDSGNTYTYVAGSVNWNTALASAASGTGGAIGDTYLATVTSQLENSIAGSAASYQASWLGGRRIVGLGTDAVWRWVAGPEGLEDGGNGRQFFTQNSGSAGGAAINGAYTNWSANEPNNWNGSPNQPLTTEYESALQFTGTAGRWNDLARTSTAPLGYVKETNAPPSPLTVNSGTATTTFTNAVGGNKSLSALTVTSNTIAVNGGGVTTTGAQTYNGNVTLGAAATTLTQTSADTDFTLPSSRNISNATGANAALTIKTTRDVVLAGSNTVTSAAGTLNVTLWSDADNTESGRIELGTSAAITSNGGHITLGGGSNPASDYAVGRAASPNEDGIRLLSNVTLNATGGNISLYGKGGTASGDNKGIEADTGSQILTSGAGTITLNGVGGTNSGAGGSSYGVDLRQNSLVQSANGAIAITGQGGSGGTGGNNHGVVIETDVPAASNGYVQSNSGPITVTGVSGDANAIRVTGNGFIGKGGLGASSSNITLVGDTLSLAATTQIESTGALIIKPNTSSTTIGIGAAAGTLSLPQSYFWNGATGIFKNGFSGITIGSAAQTGAISVDGLSYSDPLTLHAGGAGGTIALAGNLADGAGTRAGALSVIANGAISGAANVTTNDQNLLLDAGGGTGTLSGMLALGAGGLTKQGSGTTVLSGANTYTGATTINGGTLRAGAANVLADTTAVTVANGATYDLNNFTDTIGSLAGGGDVTLGSAVLTTGGNDGSTTFSGVMSGSGSLTKAGNGTFTLSGANSYTGATTITAGTLRAGAANVLSDSTAVTIANGASYDLSGFTDTIGSAAGAGNVALGAGTLTTGGDNSSTTLSGIVSGGGGLTKQGSGTFTLSGNNTYSGATLVNAGTLQAAHANALGATAGGTTVSNGATLLINGVAIGNEAVAISGAGVGAAGALQGSGTASLSGAITANASATVGGSGSLTLGALTIADGQTVTLGTGGALNVTTGAISGVGGGASSNLGVNTTGSATLGAVGTDIGAVTVTAADTTLDAVTANTIAVVDSGANGVTLNGMLTANANNDPTALVIAATKLINNAGAGALATPNGTSRWLVYTATPADDTFGGLASGNQALWNRTYAGYPPAGVVESGNRYLFSLQPTLTVTAANRTKTYGDTLDLGSPVINTDYTASGFINAAAYGNVFTQDTAANVLSGAPSLSSAGAAAGADVAGSPYAITIAAGTLAAGNGYAANYANGTLTINPKALTLSGLTANNKVYDGTTTATISNYGTLSGVLGGDTVSFDSAAASANFDTKNAGVGKTVTISGAALGGADAGNYSLANATTTADITRKTVTISGVVANDKVYDATTAATLSNNGSLSGFIGAETLVLNAPTTITFDTKNVGVDKTVTASGYSLADGANGGLAANYQLATASATATADITSRPVNLTGKANVNRTYNGTTAVPGGDIGYTIGAGAGTGLVGGDTVGITGAAVYDGANAGGRQVLRGSLALAGADAGNYTLVWVDGSGTISPAPLTMMADDAAKIIFDADPGLTASYSGFVNGETAAVLSNITITRAAGEASGAYVITPSASATNYTITPVNGTFTIYPADTLLVVLNDATKIYGDALPPLIVGSARYCPAGSCTDATSIRTLVLTNNGANNWSADDGLGGTASIDVSTAAIATTSVGVYDIAAAVTKTGNNNFNLTAVANGDLTITPRPVTVATNAVSKIYDGGVGLTGATATITNKVGADDVSIVAGGQYNDRNAGTPGYTLSGLSLTGAAAGNYSLGSLAATGVTGGGTINQATITIGGLAAQDKVYDGTTAATLDDIGALSGLIGGETLVLNAPATVTFDTKNAGIGKIVTASGYTLADGTNGGLAGNYQLAGAPVTTTADITVKALTLSGLTANDRTYDGTTDATISTYGALNGVIGADSVTLDSTAAGAAFDTRNVGAAKIVTVSGLTLGGADAGNYSIANQATTASLAAKGLTLSGLIAADKIYDATTTATIANYGTLTGVIGADSVVLDSTAASATFDTKDVGADKTVTLTALALSGGDASNYTITDHATTANVTRRWLTVTADNVARIEGETNPPLTATYTGFAAGETMATSGVEGTPLLSTVAQSDSLPGDYAIIAAPGTLRAGNYDFECANGVLTVLAVPADAPGMRYLIGAAPEASGHLPRIAPVSHPAGSLMVGIRCKAFGSLADTTPECAASSHGP